MNDLTPLVWLIAAQFAMYAIGWCLAGLIIGERQSAVIHWGIFMFLIGTGFALASMRDETRAWLPYVGSSMAFLGGYAALWHGLNLFIANRRAPLEPCLTLVLLIGALLANGPQVEAATARVLLTYGGGLWIFVRILHSLARPMIDEFGWRVSAAIGSPALLLIALYAARLLQQLGHMHEGLEMTKTNAMNIELLYAYLVGAAIFNFSFMAMVTLRMLARLRAQALLDPLTGLPNRRALEQALNRQLDQQRQRGDCFAILALDLDHFKQINDMHGHQAGDTVLELAGRRLRNSIRAIDTVARTGGEEFIVLAPVTDDGEALRLAERLRSSICSTPFTLPGGVVKVTMSIGVAISRPAERNASSLEILKNADQALYRAKANGRNTVCAA